MSTDLINQRAQARAAYGVDESNPIELSAYDHNSVDYNEGDVPLDDERLVRVDRIRLLTERGYPYYDVSYIWGTLRDGRHVRVDIGTHRIERARPGRSLKSALVEIAQAYGVNAKRLGMLDEGAISLLRG